MSQKKRTASETGTGTHETKRRHRVVDDELSDKETNETVNLEKNTESD